MSEMKRLIDVFLSAGILVFLSPVFLVLTLMIRLTSPGPAIFRQRRVGHGERLFWVLKFRSMVEDAATRGPWHTSRDDPRVTGIGRLLRKTSLDELPQLWNVLRGEMSLVGPRPDVPEQMALYTDEERRIRHQVRPGITGWAQVNGRNESSEGSRRTLDLYYARYGTLGLDVRILFMTVRQVFFRGSF